MARTFAKELFKVVLKKEWMERVSVFWDEMLRWTSSLLKKADFISRKSCLTLTLDKSDSINKF